MPYLDFEAIDRPNFTRPELLRHATIPRPLSGTAPRAVMGEEWWDKVRRQAYAWNNMRCWACGGPGPLEAHEAYDIDYEKGRMTYVETVALCHKCHAFIHMGRTIALVASRKLSYKAAFEIILHGYNLLKDAGLKCPWSTLHFVQVSWPRMARYEILWEVKANCDTVPTALENLPRWEDWRLVFGGKEYPPKYKSKSDLERKYK